MKSRYTMIYTGFDGFTGSFSSGSLMRAKRNAGKLITSGLVKYIKIVDNKTYENIIEYVAEVRNDV